MNATKLLEMLGAKVLLPPTWKLRPTSWFAATCQSWKETGFKETTLNPEGHS